MPDVETSRSWKLHSGSAQYVSVTMISVMTYTGHKVITNVVTIHIVHSTVVDRKVVCGVKRSWHWGLRSMDKFVRRFIISHGIGNEISNKLLKPEYSMKTISTFKDSCMDVQAYVA